jgi:hypothetical protein
VSPDPAFWAVVAVTLIVLIGAGTGLDWIGGLLKRRRRR